VVFKLDVSYIANN